MAKIYGNAAFAISALERRLGGIECKRDDLPVMMPAMSVRFYASAISYKSVLERDVLALDRTRVNVQTKNAVETANQAKNKIKRKKKSFFFYY